MTRKAKPADPQPSLLEAPALETEVSGRPPEPDMEPQFGDRTPAWAEWCREHDPARFVRHFHDLRPYEE